MTTSTTAQALQALIRGVLLGQTSAGANVYTPGDWSTFDGSYPALLVKIPLDHKESISTAAPQFNTTTTIRVEARASAKDTLTGGGGAAAEAAVWTLQRQIERVVINNPAIMPIITQFKFVQSRSDFTSDGREHIAIVAVDFGLEYYQGVDIFYEGGTVVIDEINIQTQFADPATESGTILGPDIDIPIPT